MRAACLPKWAIQRSKLGTSARIRTKRSSRRRDFSIHLGTREPYLVTVTKRTDLPRPLRAKYALMAGDQDIPDGFRTVLIKTVDVPDHCGGSDVLRIPVDFDYLGEGDVIRVSPEEGRIHA